MHKKLSIIVCFCLILLAYPLLVGAAGPTKENFKTPVVTLDSVEVAHAFGYWYFSKKVAPTKGSPDNVGAPLDLAFFFNIENPNAYPVKMEDLKFTVAFEEFDLNTVSSRATQWIPAGKTNQIEVHAHFDVRQSLLSLLVTGGFKLKQKGTNAWDQLEKWWTGIPEYSIPIHVKGGAAIFKAGDLANVATFSGTFPE